MYNKRLNLDFTAENVESIAKYIIAPPDGGIDIFIEYEDGDEYFYDIIQVKHSKLGQQDIKQCFAMMQRTIKDYLKDPQSVHKNLRKVIKRQRDRLRALKKSICHKICDTNRLFQLFNPMKSRIYIIKN